MRAAGLELREADGEFRIEPAIAATEQLLERHGELTARVIANNLMAIGALKALARSGRRVPEDVAIVALDDPFWAELVQPPLTVLAQPVRTMADAAMRLLLERIERSRSEPRHERFTFELRLRGSSGTERT
jgi:DNA-binding LacI/PurR family transcriptional regulator